MQLKIYPEGTLKKFTLLALLLAFMCSYSYSQRVLLTQGFQNGPYTVDSLPIGWTKFKVNGPSFCAVAPIGDWRVRDSGKAFCGTNAITDFTSKAYLTSKSLSIPWTATSGTIADDWVFTTSLNIVTGDSLKFRVQLGTWSGGTGTYYLDSLQIWITSVANPTGGTRTRIATVTSLPAGSNYWQYKTYDLSAYNGSAVYVGFRYYMNVSVDGIMVNVDSVIVGNLSGPPVGISGNNEGLPKVFDLKQNFPNPFNPATTIQYDLPKNEYVNLVVYNALGQKVATLVNEFKTAGSYNVLFDAGNMASGIYVCKIVAGDFVKTQKMLLVK
jgi:hypothetical protein